MAAELVVRLRSELFEEREAPLEPLLLLRLWVFAAALLPLELARDFEVPLARPRVFGVLEDPFGAADEVRPRLDEPLRLDARRAEPEDALPLPFEDFGVALRREAADEERPCEDARPDEPR